MRLVVVSNLSVAVSVAIAIQRGKPEGLTYKGKHVLSTCLECPCKFIPSREDQRRCLACSRSRAQGRKS
jgi:hypothetical protein